MTATAKGQGTLPRKRQNRLISVVLEHPELLGVGVDEGTAVWVRPDGTFKVLGEGWVMVFDAAGAKISRQPHGRDGEALGATGMVTHVLQPGDIFDVERRRPIMHRMRSQ